MTSRQPTHPDLICAAGRCACGIKIVRGLDNTRELATVNVYAVDAAAELLAWHAGRTSYELDLAHPRGLTLHLRTPRDIKRHPAGFKRNRIVLAHDCTKGNL